MTNNFIYSLLCLSRRDDFGKDNQGFFRFWVRTGLLPQGARVIDIFKLNSIYTKLLPAAVPGMVKIKMVTAVLHERQFK